MTNQLLNQTKKKKKIFEFSENAIPVCISGIKIRRSSTYTTRDHE